MVKKTDYSKQVNNFTQKITATIQTKGITNDKFIDDINSLKYGKLTNKGFILKYSQLFDGTYANFGNKYKNTQDYDSKAIDSFLGSYRRNINPKFYKQSLDKDVIKYNENLRTYTILQKKKKQTKPYGQKPTRFRTFDKQANHFKERLIFNGFAYNEVSHLKQVWNLTFIKNKKLYGMQQVSIVINYNLTDLNGNIIYADLWSTFSSKPTKDKVLVDLFTESFFNYQYFITEMEQSKFIVEIIESFTYVYREAN